MCGIFGKFAGNGVNPSDLERMAEVLFHRGPDDIGTYVDGCIGIGNRRLSIIDLPGGNQPISNEDGTIHIVFNGEIYNYRALREMLKQRGHTLQTSSDTEVIVHLYEDEGEDCVQHLEGMFAFAIWDAKRSRLFMARDRIGQKPLYYHHRPGHLVFGSEIKAVLTDPAVTPAVDTLAMHHYLSLRFVPPPRTMFQGIEKLPAAHWMILENGKLTIHRYWGLNYEPKLKLTEAEALEGLDTLLGDAVESATVSDVPVGAMLSGGLDSGLIVAMLSQRRQSPVFTFSVGVAEDDWSELPFAAAVAKRYGTDHHETVANPNPATLLPRLIWHLDEPSDPTAMCKYFVAQAAREHVKVVLGGDGGDEMLGGYDRYVGNRLMRYYCLLPEGLRRQVSRRLMAWVPDTLTYKSLGEKLRWLDQMSSSAADRRYATSVNFFRFDEETKRRFYSEKMMSHSLEVDAIDYIASVFRDAPIEDLIDRMLYTDVSTQLGEHGCMIVDRTSMAFGLESRSPFLDRKLAEFCAALPTRFKVRRNHIRYLQRKLAHKYLPPEVATARKQGFGLPLGYWFKSELGEVAAGFFSSSALAEDGFFNREGLLSVLDDHRSKGINHSHRLWLLLNVEIWYRLFIRGESIESLSDRAMRPLATVAA